MMRMKTRSLSRKNERNEVSEQSFLRIQKKMKESSEESEESGNEISPLREKTLFSTPRKEKSRASDHELCCVTPPKQKKSNDAIPPLTPENKGIRTEQLVGTPSSLLTKLSIDSGSKNVSKKQFKKKGRNIHRKIDKSSEDLADEKHDNSTESEEEAPKRTSIYQSARQALHSTAPTDMPGREKELEEMRNFIRNHLENKSSGSLYVSGPPGTGKTASLNIILNEEDIASEMLSVYVNCTAIKSPAAIYSKIVSELKIKVTGRSEKDYLSVLENYMKKKHKMILLVLDEIDQLENKNQSILYTIFEWPSRRDSHLILIGIANALDLTDRTLPRLQARCELKPKLMHFAPYNKQQIIEIFTARLRSARVLDVFAPSAIQMLAGKVAAVSGDVRRALDIGRRVIELADRSRKGDILKPIENLTSELLVDEEATTVELKQVLSVLNNVYGTSQNLNESEEDAFPLQQKIVICCVLLMLKKAKNKDITVGKLHEVYRRACRKRNIQAVDQAEFVGLCSLIETRGIIRVTGRKEARLHKISLVWDEEEVNSALKDKQLMSVILQDDSCLGNL